MLRLTLEFVPHGVESKAEKIGTLEIVNDLTGDLERGNYRATLSGLSTNGKVETKPRYGSVWGFPRLVKSGWDLAYAALQRILGYRNPAFSYADQELYIKRRGKYLAVGQFEGFPASGVSESGKEQEG